MSLYLLLFDHYDDEEIMSNLDLLIQLRSIWIQERDKFASHSREAIRLHFGIYALDEAINTVENGKVWRYNENGISLESMLMRSELGSKVVRDYPKPRST